jgi:RNA polymerase sigma-70 factor (ECF subfamily)
LHQGTQSASAVPPNADMIMRAQRSEEGAFEALYQWHNKRVYSLCLRMIGNTAEAEELTQEVFLLLFRKIHTFRGDSAFSTWLHRLAVNIVLMRMRKKRVSETPLEDTSRQEEFDAPPRQFGAPDLALMGSIDRLNIQRAVAQLPRGYRQIFVLHDVQGYEHHEIAALLDVSIGNSKSQLHKARMKLRKLLHERGRENGRQNELHAELV